MVLIALLQSTQDADGVEFGGFVDHHGLEAALQSLILFEIFLIFVERRRADGTQLAAGECGLEDVGGVHGALTTTCTHEGMDLIDEEDDAALRLRHLLDDSLEAFLKFALIFGTCHKGAHIERIEALVAQVLGHVTANDAFGEAFHDGGLTRTGFTDENRVVLRSAAQNLQHTADFLITADDRVKLAVAGILNEVASILLERLEVLVAALPLHLLTLAQFSDGLLHVAAVAAGIFQNACRSMVAVEHSQQNGFDADVAVALLLSELQGALKHLFRVLREISLTALHTRQMLHLGAGGLLYLGEVHAEFLHDELHHVAPFVNQTEQEVDGFNGLLPSGLRLVDSLLYGFLSLNSEFVECHIRSPFFFWFGFYSTKRKGCTLFYILGQDVRKG